MKAKYKVFLMLLSSLLITISCGKASVDNNKNKENTKVQINKTNNKMKVIHLTKEEFLKKVANYEKDSQEWNYLGDKPAIVDFYATWCGPCKSVSPILEELAEEYDGKIYIYKVDVDKEEELASAFGVRSVPTLLFIPMKGDPQIAQGAMPKSSFKEAIENVLLKN
jgi:thioredoxin